MTKPHSHLEHSKDLLRFSLPMTLTAVSAVLTGIIDSMMAGHLSVTHLAGVALASSVYFMFVIVGRGMSQGLSPIIASSISGDDHEKSQKLLSHSLLIQIVLGALLVPVLYLVSGSLELFGQTSEVSHHASGYLYVMGIFLIPQYVMQVLRTGIESHGNSKFPMLASYFTAALNVFGNWILIFGNLGFPRLELVGAALASGISNSILLVVFYIYLRRKYRLRAFKGIKLGINPEITRKLLKIGGVFAFQWFIEVGAFSCSTIIAGIYSELHLAAHQIVLNVATLTFMIPLGLSAASTIKISASISKFGLKKTRAVAKSYLITCWVATVLTSAFILLTKNLLPHFYTENTAVIELAKNLLLIAALFQFADGTQAVASGILRGYLDIKVPTIIVTFCWWLIAIPLSYLLAIPMQLGANGVWYALTLGLFLAGFLMTVRFQKVSQKA